MEDALKHIHCCEYEKPCRATLESLAGVLSIRLEEAVALLTQLRELKLLKWVGETFQLTEEGRRLARHIIRAHRLYETYLAQESGFSETLWHQKAERAEHNLSEDQIEELADRLGHPRYDPHGDPIPTREGELPPLQGCSLLAYGMGGEGKIVHIEDQPESIYAQIVELGLAPGMSFYVLGLSEREIFLRVEGRMLSVTLSVAASIRVAELSQEEKQRPLGRRLTDLDRREKAKIMGISSICRGVERRRLLELGFVMGATIEKDREGSFGSPIAYRIGGSLIALRREQAEQIFID